MKKLFLLSFVLFALGACSSDEVGPQGPPGEPGVNIVGQTFEYEGVDFEYLADDNIYTSGIIDFPEDIEILESDAILIYRRQILDGVETWSLIPQNFFLEDNNIIQYVYNQTATDVEIVIDGNFDMSTLPDRYTQDQFFRFVAVPSDFAVDNNVDVADYNAVMSVLQK